MPFEVKDPTKPVIKGQQTSAESFPVVLASDYTFAVSIPGVATEITLLTVKDDTVTLVTSAGTIVTNTGNIATSVGSINTNVASLVLVDFATSAKQDTGNASLTTIAGKDFATQTTLNALKTSVETRLGGSLVPAVFDTILPAFNPTTDVYVYKTGGTGGTTVKTITITYTDATKAVIQSIVSA
jgi:hypothetical protein